MNVRRLIECHHDDADIIYQVKKQRASYFEYGKHKKEMKAVGALDDVFYSEDHNDVLVYYYNNEMKLCLEELFNESKGNIGNYIDASYDLPGVNSLVRKGLVKCFQLSSGVEVVTKRDNSEKAGRFSLEQHNVQKISTALNLKDPESFIELFNDKKSKTIQLKMIKPFAVINDKVKNNFYSFSCLQPGKTLEEVLLTEQSLREEHLSNARLILDYLYDHGVLWGDMAPRNILVDLVNDVFHYYILDFEKTKILDRAVTLDERYEHCRGPVCVEEFGAICTKEEVENCFDGYFNPEKWDFLTTTIVPYSKPKRELVSIFEAANKKSFTFGEYNALESKVMEVRFPLVDVTNKITRYPLIISFKVDHYLGGEYDRKTTELLIAAKKYHCIENVVDILNSALKNLDNKMMIDDAYQAIFFGSTHRDSAEIDQLKMMIDDFYLHIDDLLGFKSLVAKHEVALGYYQNKFDQMIENNGSEIAGNNFAIVDSAIKNILKKTYKKYKLELIVVVGGFGRKELTYGSDIDIAMFSENGNLEEAKYFVRDSIKLSTGLEVDFFLNIPLKDLNVFLSKNTDFLDDFICSRYICGTEKCIRYYESIKVSAFNNLDYLLTDLKQKIFATTIASDENKAIKSSLSLLRFITYVQKNFNLSTDSYDFILIKKFLLYCKNENQFNLMYNFPIKDFDEALIALIKSYLFVKAGELLSNISGEKNITCTANQYAVGIFSAYSIHKNPVSELQLNELDPPKLSNSFSKIKTDFSVAVNKNDFLSESIIPKDYFIVSAKGATFTMEQGDLIDMSSMTVNCVLGQNDPWVKSCQIAYLLTNKPSFHSSRLGSETYYKYPKRLAALSLGGIINPIINHRQCNGSDVTELAIKAAYSHRAGRTTLISFKGSYHGQNLTAYLASHVQLSHGFMVDDSTSSNVVFLNAPSNSYAPFIDKLTYEETQILKQLEILSSDVYGVIIEPIQMNNGVNTCSQAFLMQLRRICTDYHICLIFDEVQTGFGWLGELTAADVYGVKPDVLALGKGVTSGNGPLAIIVAEKEYGDFGYGTSEKTNGGDLRSLIAADAVLDRLIGVAGDTVDGYVGDTNIRKELSSGLLCTIPEKSILLEKYLQTLKINNLDVIGGIKGFNMMRGIEILNKNEPDIEYAEKIASKCLSKGVFVRRNKNVLIIKPPIVITDIELKKAFEIIDSVLLEIKYESACSIASEKGELVKPRQI